MEEVNTHFRALFNVHMKYIFAGYVVVCLVQAHILRASSCLEPYIQYFGRLEASQNNIVHFDMKKSISVDGILVEYVGSSCSENVISIKMRVPLIHYSEM